MKIESILYYSCFNRYNKTKPNYVNEFVKTIDFATLLGEEINKYSTMNKKDNIVEFIYTNETKSKIDSRQVLEDKDDIQDIIISKARANVINKLIDECMDYIYNKELELDKEVM